MFSPAGPQWSARKTITVASSDSNPRCEAVAARQFSTAISAALAVEALRPTSAG
jgi:hypothetical protein